MSTSLSMSWVYLILAIVLEVVGSIEMKLSDGFTKPLHSVLLFVFYALSFFFVTISLKKIDMSTTYAVWSGLGTALITIIGITAFKEPMGLIKFGSIALIIVGVIGLNVSSSGGH